MDRRMLCSKTFNATGEALREEIASLAKNLLTTSYHPLLIEPKTNFFTDRAKTNFPRQKARNTTLPTPFKHGAGAEAAVHAVREMFESDDIDAVLLIDATNGRFFTYQITNIIEITLYLNLNLTLTLDIKSA